MKSNGCPGFAKKKVALNLIRRLTHPLCFINIMYDTEAYPGIYNLMSVYMIIDYATTLYAFLYLYSSNRTSI